MIFYRFSMVRYITDYALVPGFVSPSGSFFAAKNPDHYKVPDVLNGFCCIILSRSKDLTMSANCAILLKDWGIAKR